jgi:hypothetical protein
LWTRMVRRRIWPRMMNPTRATLTQLSLLGGIFNYFWRSGCQIANDLMGFEV